MFPKNWRLRDISLAGRPALELGSLGDVGPEVVPDSGRSASAEGSVHRKVRSFCHKLQAKFVRFRLCLSDTNSGAPIPERIGWHHQQ